MTEGGSEEDTADTTTSQKSEARGALDVAIEGSISLIGAPSSATITRTRTHTQPAKQNKLRAVAT
jgi:hypothetical protein